MYGCEVCLCVGRGGGSCALERCWAQVSLLHVMMMAVQLGACVRVHVRVHVSCLLCQLTRKLFTGQQLW